MGVISEPPSEASWCRSRSGTRPTSARFAPFPGISTSCLSMERHRSNAPSSAARRRPTGTRRVLACRRSRLHVHFRYRSRAAQPASNVRRIDSQGCCPSHPLTRSPTRAPRAADCSRHVDARVMEILGHSQIGVTMNIYGNVLRETQHEAAALMNGALGG